MQLTAVWELKSVNGKIYMQSDQGYNTFPSYHDHKQIYLNICDQFAKLFRNLKELCPFKSKPKKSSQIKLCPTKLYQTKGRLPDRKTDLQGEGLTGR